MVTMAINMRAVAGFGAAEHADHGPLTVLNNHHYPRSFALHRQTPYPLHAFGKGFLVLFLPVGFVVRIRGSNGSSFAEHTVVVCSSASTSLAIIDFTGRLKLVTVVATCFMRIWSNYGEKS